MTDLSRIAATSWDSAEEFSSWVTPFVPAMARLASRLAPDLERDDVVQEALLRAWNKRRQFDPRRGTPLAWLLAITSDQARKARLRRHPSSVVLDVPTRIRPTEDRMDLEFAIARLPTRQRLAVDCYYIVGLPVA